MSYSVTTDRIDDIARRLHRVVDCQAFEREQKMGRLLDYRPDGPDAVLRILATENLRYRARRIRRAVAMCVAALLWLALLPSGAPVPAMVAALIWLLYLAGSGPTATQRQMTSAQIISRLDSQTAIPILIELLPVQDRAIRRIAEESLIRLLPDLRDGRRISERHLRILRRELNWQRIRPHHELMVAILHALAVIGDRGSISVVRALAKSDPIIEKGRRVRDEAAACLNVLSALPAARESLLRAVDTVPDPMLLRPIVVDNRLLVRPANLTSSDEQPQDRIGRTAGA